MLLFSLIAGILLLLAGIVVFSGKWGSRRWTLTAGPLQLNYEAIGFVLFFSGIVLMLVFLIARVKPHLLSPGMAG
ncbi:MAG: hypothetical protein RMK52_08605 [Chitinophagales bacterium]|nr:hypothetical protein [Chitinophagales bacterium]MDW8394287.1 hypothetical protein [Chitinophagales bacterium]